MEEEKSVQMKGWLMVAEASELQSWRPRDEGKRWEVRDGAGGERRGVV